MSLGVLCSVSIFLFYTFGYEMLHPVVRIIALNEMYNFLAPKSARGRPRTTTATELLDALETMCRISQPWWRVRAGSASYKTIHRTFMQMHRVGVFDRIHKQTTRVYLSRRRPKYHATDTTYIKNICGRDCIGRNPTDRGRNATKISSITDDLGVTLTFTLFPGNRSDQIVLPATLTGFDVPPGMELFADKGYDSRANRALVCLHGYRDRIGRRGQRKGHNARRKRVVIEHSYAHLKQFRHLRNRYDHAAASYSAFVSLACAIHTGQVMTSQKIV